MSLGGGMMDGCWNIKEHFPKRSLIWKLENLEANSIDSILLEFSSKLHHPHSSFLQIPGYIATAT
jgi:hypothetical protein